MAKLLLFVVGVEVGMGKQVVECKNCNNVGESKLKGSTLISFVLFWFFAMIPGIIYMIWCRGGIGVCKFCSSDAVIPYNGRRTKVVQGDVFQPKAIADSSNEVKQINCPDCRELIRFDARKCKHCGSMVDEQ